MNTVAPEPLRTSTGQATRLKRPNPAARATDAPAATAKSQKLSDAATTPPQPAVPAAVVSEAPIHFPETVDATTHVEATATAEPTGSHQVLDHADAASLLGYNSIGAPAVVNIHASLENASTS